MNGRVSWHSELGRQVIFGVVLSREFEAAQ